MNTTAYGNLTCQTNRHKGKIGQKKGNAIQHCLRFLPASGKQKRAGATSPFVLNLGD
jgi:hypothetical protein